MDIVHQKRSDNTHDDPNMDTVFQETKGGDGRPEVSIGQSGYGLGRKTPYVGK